MGKEIRKETDGFGREREIIYEDGEKIGEVRQEKNWYGGSRDRVYDNEGNRVSETIHGQGFWHNVSITKDSQTGEIGKTYYVKGFGGNREDLYQNGDKIGELKKRGETKVLTESPGHDVDLRTRRDRRVSYSDRHYHGYDSENTGINKEVVMGVVGAGILAIAGLVYGIGYVGNILSADPERAKLEERLNSQRFYQKPMGKTHVTPSWTSDYSLSPDNSFIVFSSYTTIDKKYDGCALSSQNVVVVPLRKGEFKNHFRIFLQDLKNNSIWNLFELAAELGADKRILFCMDYEDIVAPVFSPDCNRIAFATTRDDHHSRVYVINTNGTDLKMVSKGHDTIAFGWVSNKDLFIWGDYDRQSDIFNPSVYDRAESSLVDVVNFEKPARYPWDLNTSNFPRYLPNKELNIKIVSGGKVRECVMDNKR